MVFASDIEAQNATATITIPKILILIVHPGPNVFSV